MNSSFEATSEERDDFFDDLEQKIFKFSQDFLKRTFRDINTNLMRKFKLIFEYDGEGKAREWRVLEEAQIREEWVRAK